jgi:hypothetical protein
VKGEQDLLSEKESQSIQLMVTEDQRRKEKDKKLD